jgi:hypothetical protein
MARPNTGEVTQWPWKNGTTITYGARLYAYGRRHRLVFGTNTQGWNDVRAEIELESILQQVERGTWMPPEKRTSVVRTEAARPDGHQPFGPFARKVVDAKKSHGLDDSTIADLEWKLGYLIGHFGRMELLEIDVARVDGFRDELAHRSRVIREAEARGKPLMETVERKPGKPYKRRKRPLSNTSINGLLTLLSQIMQRAVDYSHVAYNPLKVGERKDRFLPSVKPDRTFLEVDELLSLLDAAGELDEAARRDRRVGRRAALVTLGLSGFRISRAVRHALLAGRSRASPVQAPRCQDSQGRPRGRDDAVESRRARSPPRAALARRLPDGAGRPLLRHCQRTPARPRSLP